MKINEKEREILDKHFKVYEDSVDYGLESWTNGGVDMNIYITKDGESLIDQLQNFVDDFDIDEAIDLHRQGSDYKRNFTISESLKDFEDYIEFISSVIEELEDLHKHNKDKYYFGNKRKCSNCGKKMTEGYCIDNGLEYYCSDECLHKHYKEEEYEEMYDDGNGDSYYTEWED